MLKWILLYIVLTYLTLIILSFLVKDREEIEIPISLLAVLWPLVWIVSIFYFLYFIIEKIRCLLKRKEK